MISYTIQDLKAGYIKGEFSPEEIFNSYKTKAEEQNKKLNAFLNFLPAPEKVEYPQGELYGIPAAIKDNMLVKGSIATAGSKILSNYVSAYDATVISNLKRSGALILGKTNLDEFAMGSSTENSAFGPTHHPLNLEYVPGGSSGGSAAAVAADLCAFGLGSDTGGSIRQPASFCGIVGLKPTYGRVSRSGLIAMASSLDQIGPLTKNVYDAALVLKAISGPDDLDSTTTPTPAPDFTLNINKPIKGLRVGVPKEFFGEGLNKAVNERIQETIKKLESLGTKIEEISLPHAEYALATYYIIMPSEVSSNLARFDGIRYGYSAPGENLLDGYVKTKTEGFGREARRRIILGTYALSSGYYDAYYNKAQKVRALIKQDFDKAFQKVDVIVGPTSPSVAFKIGDKSEDPLSMYLSDIYTVAINLAGIPAISIPCGNDSEKKLPVGFQIIGKAFDEETVLRVGHQLEAALL